MKAQLVTGAEGLRMTWPESGYAARLRLYLSEMYPPAPRLASAFLIYLSFTILLAAIHGRAPLWEFSWILLGGLGGFCLGLILRLMDELKDRHIDRHLFPHRPVPSGRVKLSDLRVTLAILLALLLILHAGSRTALLSASALGVYSLLMFRYFFLPPRWKAKLLVNLATHNPVGALLLLHYVLLFALQYGIRLRDLRFEVLAVWGLYWALLLSWELGRKIRYPEEESDYQTYSRIFGPAGTVAVTLAVQTLALALGLVLVATGAMTPAYLVLPVVAYASLVRDYDRFLRHQMGSGRLLRTSAERFAAVVMCAGLVEYLLRVVKNHVL